MTSKHYSFSQLAMAAACGEQYRLKYVEGLADDITNVPAVAGSAFHQAVAEEEVRNFLTKSPATESNLIALTRMHAKKEALKYGGPYSLEFFGKQTYDWWMKTKVPILAANYTAVRDRQIELGWKIWGENGDIGVELECHVDFNDQQFLGYIDLVLVDPQGNIVLVDLKTGAAKESHAIQLHQYEAAFYEKTGIQAQYVS